MIQIQRTDDLDDDAGNRQNQYFPFKNLLLLLALFSVSLMITRLVKFYNYILAL